MKRIIFFLALVCTALISHAQAVTVTQPNGTEQLYSCQTYQIKWTATGTSNFWVIDYSLNNGAIWTSVATNLSVNASGGVYTYNWTIPFVASPTALVRVRDYNDTLKQDVSNAAFNISYPVTTISPNGGETWQGLSQQTISWNAQGTSGVFAIEYSTNNGTSWGTIATNVTGNNYVWTVPNNPTTQALIRVRDNANTCQNDISNATFTISPATPIVTVPNGGETWVVNSNRTITWNQSTYYSNVDIEYSTNGGSTWTSIASNQSNTGSYSWLVPNTPSANAKIRVSNTANPTINDVSDAAFTILMPTPQVTYPNGGEPLDVSTSINITWNSASYVSPVRIEYSTTGGTTWTLITSSTTNNGSYAWTVPNIPTTTALVRIFNTVYTTFGDTSNAVFTIRPIVKVIFPNLATDTLRACQPYNIQYQKTPASVISFFYFYYSTDGGATYNYIASQNNNTNTSNNYNWTVPLNTNSNNCKVKIEAYNTGGVVVWADSSDNAFKILMPQGNINITAPNGGINLNALTNTSITWTATATSGTYDLFYCTNGTASCSFIATVTGNNYTWTVPNQPTTNMFVRIRDAADQCKYDTSNAANTIVAAKPILTAPNGGENWNVATTQNITWNQSTLYSNAKLEYSIDAGGTWNNITTGTTNNGSYAWTIPNAPSTQALVRISNVANNAIADTSNAVFTISQPQITVTQPTAVTQLQVGQTYNLQWTTGPGVTNVRLEYSTDGGLTWSTIVTSTTNDGNENWVVPNIAGTQTVVRVSNTANLLVNGQSPQFTVLKPVTVTLPNGGETLVGCQTYNIQLTKSPFIGSISLSYSADGGLSWNSITSVSNNGSATQSYAWTVPNINTTQALVRAEANSNPAQRDSSDGLFTISPSQDITVTTPGAPIALTPNQTYIISWTNTSNVSGIYQIYWRDSLNNTYSIASNVTGNNYIWTVPNTPGGNARFLIYDQNNSCRFDRSDTTFSIRPFSPQLQLPNGGEQLEVGTTYNIDWNENTYYNNVRIEYSLNAGLTWTLLSANYANSNGVYPWTVPNTPSTNCLVRVLTFNNLALGDTSNATFTIKRPLTITRPAANDSIVDCNSISVQWDKTPAAGTLTNNTIQYSADNGLTWNTITSTLTGIAGNSQSYNWTSGLPGPGSYIIRVINNNGYSDTTDAPFHIIPFNGITVVTPNGGQTWGATTSQLIGWTAQPGISSFNLQYSLNGGTSFNTIANAQPGYSYSWTLPNVNSNNVIIRIVDNANSCRTDVSNAPLTIIPLQPILTAPNGGEVWSVNSSQAITWNQSTFHSAVKLAYSIDNGANWILITNSTTNNGSYAWTVPNGVSTQCRVRASNVQDTTWFDISDATFSIVQPKPILTYPNGGEVLEPAAATTITWNANSVNSTNVRLEFSNNNGFTWNTIVGNASNTGSYNGWTPAGSNYSLMQCLIRIVNIDFPTQMDTSNAVFTINPYIRLTYPNATTDTIRNCQTINVAFRKYPQGSGTYYGFYSTNNGATWDNFGSVNTVAGNTNYTIPFTVPNAVPSGPIKFKVNVNGDPYLQSYVFQDSSDAAGVVVYPPIDITVTAPNGGETLTALTNTTISWTNGPSVSGTYRIRYFSTTTGLASVASGITGNSYVWTVPNVVNPGTDWKIRVEDQSNSCKIDSSNNFFTILPATPVITSPNGGEFWGANSSQTITWTTNTFFTTTVKIEYSLDNGATWIVLALSTTNDGSEPWTVPNTQSSTALVRISTTSAPILSDVSNAVFTVGYPTPILTAPNSGTFEYSQPVTISWDPTSINSTTTRLEYSTDSMQTWTLITSATTSTGSYAWTVPQVTTTKLFVRVLNTLNLNVWDASNTAMTILRPMRLTSFNTQQNVIGCQTVTFTVSRSPYIVETGRIQYSIDGGATWVNAGSFTSGGNVNQTATWTVPNITATNVQYRALFTTTQTYADTADVATHTITADYPITLTSPNTNVQLVPGQNYTISWTNTANVSGIFELNLYKNGAYIQNIATNVTGNNYIWTVPNNPGAGAFSIRILDGNNTCKYDSSDVRFTILPNTPLLTSPNGGETWWAFQSQNITWNSATFYNNVRLDYSLDSGLTWINIASSTTNNGTFSWAIPSTTPYTTKALVKVSDATNLALFDVSNAVFTIKPMVRILTPNGGATLGACTNSSISFEHSPYIWNQGWTFTIQYTLNNGVSYTNLTTNQSASSNSTITYNYQLPNSSTTQYAVRVLVTQSPNYNDISDSVTTIRPAVTIVQPNFGGVLQVGSSYQIKWSSDGISNLYNLYYSTSGPSGPYSAIQLNYNTSTNQYLWTVPNAPTTNGYVVIQDATASCKADTSNIAFTISSTANAVTVTAPNGGDTLTGCQNYNITWTEPGTPAGQYNIAYSADAGATFNTIVNNYATTSGSYTWVVPNTINSANVLVRVALSSTPTSLDMSNALLTILNGRVVATPDTTICQGNTVQLFATGGNNVFSWTPSVSLNNANIPNPIASPTVTTTYTATSNNAGCIVSDTARVTVIPGGVVTAGVSIGVSPSTGICSGTNVTFTATPTNGGTTPSYQWKKNNVNVGLNSPVYATNIIASGDVITCVMTSNASCVTGNPATSNAITMTVFPTVAPSVSITSSGNSICAGANVTFTATPVNGGGAPTYQWKVNGNNVTGTGNTYASTTLNNNDIVSVEMTSNASCATPLIVSSNSIQVTVNQFVTPTIAINTSATTVCSGQSVQFTSTITNGGANPVYQWKKNNTNVGTGLSTYTTTTLANGDVITCQLTSNAACANPTQVTSNSLAMTVTTAVVPAVTIVANDSDICAGTTVNFTATGVNGGTTPTYQWKVNTSNVGTGTASFSSNSLANNDVVTVVMTSSSGCASPTTATSPGITMVVNPTSAPSVNVTATATTICSGTQVTFTANATNAGNTPTYQWSVNGNAAGTNSNTFITSTLNNNDAVRVTVTSSSTCASPNTATSNTVTVTVNSNAAASVSISASNNNICAGTNVTFMAIPTNGGASPAYQWKVNGNNVGSNSASFSSATLVNNDVVTVQLTSNAACATPNVATSNGVTMTVTPVVAPTVSIATASTTICAGAAVTFIATATNEGSAPIYQWKVNGNNAGSGGPSFTTSSLTNGQTVSVSLTSNATCASPLTVNSNTLNMVVNPTVTPSVQISASATSICAGGSVTFTASATNGGSNPAYQWKVNGNNAGTGGTTFTTTSLNNNDAVTVVLTSNAACASTTTATSNSVTVTVGTAVTPTVTIATANQTICAGAGVTFTATATNGGGTPAYQWKVNGNNAGTNSASFTTTTLANTDVVSVVLTSNAACATSTSVTSNSLTMTVNPSVTPSVSISSSATTICAGTSVTFTAIPVNGGTPTYQWKVNGNNVGSGGATFTSSTLNNNDLVSVVMTSNAACASPLSVTSTGIAITVNPLTAPTISVSASATTICAGVNVTFNATVTNAGSTPTYQWKVNNGNVGTNSPSFSSTTLNNNDVVTCQLTSSNACSGTTTVTSTGVTITVTPSVTPSVAITSTATSICTGASVTFTATPTNGGTTPSYQWKINGNNAGTNSATFTTTALANNDAVTVVLTSNATCTSQPTATSNSIAMTVGSNATPTISISTPSTTVCAGANVTFTATITNGGFSPSYQWKINGNNAGTNAATFSTTALTNGAIVTCVLTSNATCVTQTQVTSSGITMSVNQVVTPAVSIQASTTTICAGVSVTFTASPTNGGNTPAYQWLVNGSNAGTNSNTFTSTALNNGDIVTVVMTSAAPCPSQATATSNAVTMVVNPSVAPTVSVTPSTNNICAGTSVTFNAAITNGGSLPVYQWKVNGNNTGSNSATFTSTTLANNDVVTVQLTSNASCAVPNTATSTAITTSVSSVVTPTITVSSTNSVCVGSVANFSATITNGGAAPSYQWKVNGNNVGTDLATFSSSSLSNGDIVTAVLTSNANCALPVSVTSNQLTVNLGALVTPTVQISASATSICTGGSVTFTATPTNGGNAPVYQWLVNGNNAGTGSATFTTTALNNSDVVSVQLTSNAGCVTTTNATSNAITVTVGTSVTPTIGISASATSVCAGSSITFTATATNGGTIPVYQWKVNGIATGTNSSTFTTSSLSNNDVVTCSLTSNAACASPLTVTSAGITVTVNIVAQPTVSISASATSICTGSSVTFTATAASAGGSPGYQWKVNGNNAGVNSASFTSTTLANNDVVTVVVTSSDVCGNGATNTSNAITMSISSSLTPTVSVQASATTICTNSSVTFTATATNGGSSPSYQWKVNGNNAGTNSATFTSNTFANGDVVTVEMTSSETCVNGAIATSAPITITTTGALVPTVSVSATSTTICAGTSVTFSATATNGGSSPVYQWKVNGSNAGSNSDIFTSSTLADNDVVTVELTSSEQCASPNPVSANGVIITVGSGVSPTVTVGVTPAAAVCANTNVVFTASPTFGGTTPTYLWKVNGTAVGSNSAVYSGNSFNDGDIVTVEMTSSETCVSQSTAVSTPQTMTIYALPAVPTISQSGNVLTSSAVVGNQWLQNGAPISGASSQVYTINADGWYAVEVTNTNGCSVKSDSVSFLYTGIYDVVLKDAVQIMPNPFTEYVVVNIANNVKDLSKLTLNITNELGQVVFETKTLDYMNKFDFNDKASGVYYINILDGKQRSTFKVMKQN